MAERFSEAFLDDLRAALSITDLIGQYVKWEKGKGRDGDRWACCPFHGESTPSFHAEDAKGKYHCFGCGASGDHFAFLIESQGMSFPEAVQTVADLAGVPMPEGMEVAQGPQRVPEHPRQEKAQPQPSAASEKRELVKVYPYTDNDGELLYEVCRFQIRLPDGSFARTKDGKGTWKTFLQRRPSGLLDGSIIWGLREGEYIRSGPGKDWSPWDQAKANKWPDHEVRWFGPVDHTIYRHPEVEIAISENKPVLIVEGEKDADTAVALGFCGTTNSSGSKHWTEKHASCFRDADVVICLDNDAAGDRVDVLARSMKGIARRIRVLNFADHVPDFPEKHDITDWVEAGGIADDLQRIIDSLPNWKAKPPKSKLNAVTLSSVVQEARKHQWLVQDMIELGGSAAFAGFSQSGKSFMMIELAFAVALGRPFWGRDVMQGLVVYQTGEGDRGFMKRVQGYMLDRGIEDPASVPMLILPKKINLFVDDKDTETLIAETKAWAEHYEQPLRMIVIDTFNKATRGANEISGLDMGRVIDRIERIAEECQCTVMVVDHLSAQGRFRGHGSKTGDLTNVLMVEMTDKTDRNGRKIRRIRSDKNKDGESGQVIPFVLRQVVVGFDDLNRPITTCVVEAPDGDDDEETKRGRLSHSQALVLQSLRDVIGREGEPPPVGITGVPKGRQVVTWKAFLAEMRRKWVFTAPEGEPEKRAAELNRVIADAGKKLQLAGFIDRDNDKGLIWWTGKEDRAFVRPAPEPVPDLPADVKRELAEVGNDDPPF